MELNADAIKELTNEHNKHNKENKLKNKENKIKKMNMINYEKTKCLIKV